MLKKLSAALIFACLLSQSNAQIVLPGGGSSGVTSVSTSCGVSGGPITTTGTVSGISTDSPVASTSYTVQTSDCGLVKRATNASATTYTFPAASGFSAGFFFTYKCESAGGCSTSGTIDGSASAISIANGKSVDFYVDGSNGWHQLPGNGGSSVSAANPTATASDTAVNGSASTFMRSDAAPAVQKGTNAQFGLAEGDGKTVSLSAGVAGLTSIYHPGYKSGNWYPPYGAGNPQTGSALTASTVYCHPWVVPPPSSITIKTLGLNATTTAAGNASMALYNNDASSGRPGTKIDDIGSTGVSTAATPVTHAVANTTDVLNPGVYWACMSSDNTSAIFASIAASVGGGGEAGLIGTATLINALSTSSAQITGVSCTAATTCNGASFAWSGTTFTWPATLVGSTWADIASGRAAMVGLQIN